MAEANQNSAQLLRRLSASQDVDAWSKLIDQHGAEIFKVVRRILPDESAAEDACQETLLQLRVHAGQFSVPAGASNPEECARRWIVRIAANTALMMLRKRIRNERVAVLAHNREGQASPDESALQNETLSRVYRELSELPELLRSAVLLRFHASLNYEELAAELRCPVGTAKARVSRGIERLRERVATGGVILTAGELEALFLLGAAGAAMDADRLARWKQIVNSNRLPSVNAIPHKGLSFMAKMSIASAGVALASILALVTIRGWSEDTSVPPGGSANVGSSMKLSTPINTATTLHNDSPKAPTTAENNADRKDVTGTSSSKDSHAATPESADARANAAVAAIADSRKKFVAAARDIVASRELLQDMVIMIWPERRAEKPITVNADGKGNFFVMLTHGSRKLSQVEFLDFLNIATTDIADLPDFVTKVPQEQRCGQLGFIYKGTTTSVILTNDWKNGDAFWKAVDALSGNEPAPKPVVNVALNDMLKLIAEGKQTVDSFEVTALFSTGKPALTAKFAIGDETPHVSVRIAAGNVKKPGIQVQKSVVSDLKPVDLDADQLKQLGGPVFIPVFTNTLTELELTEADLRHIAGALAELGLKSGGVSENRGGNDDRDLRVDVLLNGQNGSISFSGGNPDEGRRAAKLLDLLNRYVKRPAKK
jgi:RNA polymerase sigma factor (sigma-70 family)